ncbi:MAG: class 1 fructose-bisphosphatase [Candidatus Thermoplasmatota archaeon]|nr:class 1 fructose-bisphosphatase [Candidatus Thermoplasmatota archaeon]
MLLEDHIPKSTGNLGRLILEIASLSKRIRSGFLENQGIAGTKNMYGETQVEMDKYADNVLVEGLSRLPYVASVASEERDDVISVNDDGEFSIVFDPLDGSSLMGVNLTVGTIVGIFRSRTPFHPGSELAGAMYVLYGPLTTIVYTIGDGLHEFVVDREDKIILQKEDLKIGDKKIFSPGGLRREYTPQHLRFIRKLEEMGYKIRFAGAFVADVHQILYKGGVFTYPATIGHDNGKLRLLFEAIPMGFIVSQGGGAASDGNRDILSIIPEKIDQRVPIYIGGKAEIRMINEEFSKE